MKSLFNKLAITALLAATIFSCKKENINQLKPYGNNEIEMNNLSVKLDTPYTSNKSADTPYVNIGNFIYLDTPYIHKNGIDTPYVKKF